MTPPPETLDYLLAKPDILLRLDALVVLEGTDLKRARSALGVASKAFDRVGVDLDWRFRKRSIPDLGLRPQPYLEWLKKDLGGVRQRGFDVVYLMASRRFSGGFSDCIGGIAHPDRAFAVGALEWRGLVGARAEPQEVPGPQPPLADGGAKLVVHEIGHLLGAQHHYGACGGSPPVEDPPHPCDVMNPLLVQQIGLHYGPLSASVVSHYAERFLQPESARTRGDRQWR